MRYRIVKINKNNGNISYIVESRFIYKKDIIQWLAIPQMWILLWTPLIIFIFWREVGTYDNFDDAKKHIETEINKHNEYIEKHNEYIKKKIGNKIKSKEVVFP